MTVAAAAGPMGVDEWYLVKKDEVRGSSPDLTTVLYYPSKRVIVTARE